MKLATWGVLDPVQIVYLWSSGLSSTGWFVTADFRQHISISLVSKGQDRTNILSQNVIDKQPMLLNISGDWRSQLRCGRSLKFHGLKLCEFSFPHLLTELKSKCDIRVCWAWLWFTGHIKLYILSSSSSARKWNLCTLAFSCHPHHANINHRVQIWHLKVYPQQGKWGVPFCVFWIQ